MDINQQQHLANFAPKPSLDKYSKGADPRVISGIVALSEMQEQAAMRQRANLASGAASGQMPTVRDKIMALFQQSNPRQAQMQPNPMQQGIAAQAHPNMQTAQLPTKMPQEAPQEAPQEMYSGGVARLPVRDDMFGYAGGGIIAFKKGDEVPKAEETTDDTLPPEVAADVNRRMQERTAEKPEAPSEYKRQMGEVAKLLSQGIGNVVKHALNYPGTGASSWKEKPEQPAPSAAPATANLGGIKEPEYANVGANAAPPVSAARPPAPPAAPARPAAAKPPGGPAAPPSDAAPSVDQLITQQQKLLQAANAPVGPQLPEKSITDKATDFLKAQDKYVREAGESEGTKQLKKFYTTAAERAKAEDAAEAAQRAADDRSNLWALLSSTRGSSLAVGAGNANAAIQPLLAEQRKANREYRKYSYERDMSREKAQAEATMAEEARKRGDFAKAIEHEQKERTYLLEAKKAADTAQHYRNTEINQALQIQATRESAKEGHQVQREGHNVNLEIARLNRQATLAAHPDYVAEYQKRIASDGQKAADAWLDSVGKVLGVTKGYNLKEEGLDVQRDKAVTAALKDYDPYNRALQKIAALENQQRAGKLKPEKQTELDTARADAKRYYDQKYQEIHGTARPARTSESAAPQAVTTQEEYSKLPSGTRFVAPDGSIRVKP